MGAPSAIGKVGTTIGASEKILNFLSKPFIIGGISSGTSTLVGESLETMTGTNKRGIEQIGLDVLEDLILGGIANYAQTECQFRYCGTAIPFLTVRSTAR